MLDLAHVWLPLIMNRMHERVNMNSPATKVCFRIHVVDPRSMNFRAVDTPQEAAGYVPTPRPT